MKNIPRFTLLQLLGLMTICGVLSCIAAIDPVGSGVAFAIFVACLATTLLVFAVSYLLTRLVSELLYLLSGRPPAAQSTPFALATAPSPAQPLPDLETAVEALRHDTERELAGEPDHQAPQPPESRNP